jgi:hypothetical protein
MTAPLVRRLVVGLALLLLPALLFPGSLLAGDRDIPVPFVHAVVKSKAADRAVTRAVELLPKRPRRVVIIDVSRLEPQHRDAAERLDAFITNGGSVVYITSHSQVLTGAVAGSGFHLHMLASIIWHEMAHLHGADEAEARRVETRLWKSFLQQGQVDPVAGLRYLALLEQRPDTHVRLALR